MIGLSLLPHGLGLNEWIQRLPHSLPLGKTPFIEIERRGSIRLLKYESPQPVHQPIFMIPSLINRFYVLDLLPGKSLIEFLTRQGFTVYLMDWGIPTDEDRHLELGSLMENRIEAFIDKALELEETSSLHLLGHCLGGTLASITASLFPEKIHSLTLLTTPIHFPSQGKLSMWAQHPSFDVDALIEAYGHAPWALLQSAFQAIKPTLWLKKAQKVIAQRNNPEFQKNFWALEIWTHDNISLLGPAFRTLLKELYRRNALAQNQMNIGGKTISLKKIRGPVLNIYAQDDHIVTPEAVLRPSDLPDSDFYEELPLKGGHVGAVLTGKSAKTLWPEMSQWMIRQETRMNG